MKYKGILLQVLLLTCFSLAAQETKIVTSQGTHVLTPPEQCINSTCLNGIIRIAEIAGTALAADISSAANESKSLDNQIKSAAAALEAAKSEYATVKAPYDTKLGIYVKDVDVHNKDVGANNARKPEERSGAEVDRLNRNKSSLDGRKTVLDSEYDFLMTKWNVVKSKKADLDYRTGEALRMTDKLNKALEQLKSCKSFGERALQVVKEKNWGSYTTVNDFFGTLKIVPSIDLLNSSIEQMKAWVDKQW